MPRRPEGKPPGEEGKEPETKKYSILVPRDLDRKLGQIVRKRKILLSRLVREILDDHVESYWNEAYGRGECDEMGFRLDRPDELTIQVSPEIRQLVIECARDMNVKAAAVVQLTLSRHLASLVAESTKLREQIRKVMGGIDPPAGPTRGG